MKKINRSKIPTPKAPRAFNFPQFEKFKLDNGLQVLFAPHSKLPLVTIELLIKSGANYDIKGKEGIASLTTNVLGEGTNSKSSQQISQGFDELGTQFHAHTGWNASYLEMVFVKKHLKASMDLYCDILYNPAFAEEEIERIRKKLIHSRVRVADNAGSIAQEMFNRVLFPDSRYALPVIGQSKQIKSFIRDDIISFYDAFYQPENSTLIIVGDLTIKEAKNLAQEYFSSWKNKAVEEIVEPAFKLKEKKQLFLVHKKDAQQAEIRLGHLGIDRQNPDYYSALLLNQILGGYFLSRLNMNLREDKGFTYGIHSRFVSRKATGSFLISSAVETKFVVDAVTEILKEMKTIRHELVSDEELEQAKGYMTGIFPIAFESGAQIAEGLSSIVEQNLPDDYFRTYKDYILKISKEQILAAAQKYLHPDKATIVVCTDKDVLEDKLKKTFDVITSEYQPEG